MEMRLETNLDPGTRSPLKREQWFVIGLAAVVVSIIAVLVVQMLALAIWPEIAAFRPLDNYARSALFTLVPAIAAVALFAWLVNTRARPVRAFLTIAAVVLLLSFIPDYTLPDPNRTFLASTVAAFMHLVAAIAIVGLLVTGYRRATRT